MCRFIETIKIQNHKACNPGYHQERIDRTFWEFFGSDRQVPVLDEILVIPDELSGSDNVYKCRIVYSYEIEEITFQPYEEKQINSLKLVNGDQVSYSYKYADRENLIHLLKQRGDCDDVLIVKNGLITDTSYCNILFFNGRNWVTPETPLLRGTKREQLIRGKKIDTALVRPQDLIYFSHFMLINAMLDFDPDRMKPVSGIKY